MSVRKVQELFVHGPFPGANRSLRGNRQRYGREKGQLVQLVAECCTDAEIRPVVAPVRFGFRWVVADRRRDPDNVDADRKAIIDGLRRAGVIDNDGWSLYGDGDRIAAPWFAILEVGTPVGVHVSIEAALRWRK